jgi:hypothetical protein
MMDRREALLLVERLKRRTRDLARIIHSGVGFFGGERGLNRPAHV